MASDQEKGTVRAVERALDILLCFADAETHELGLTDISKKLSLHKSTVHRLLASLESKGFIRRNQQTEKYRLGWSVLELVSNVNQSDDLATIVLPEMTRLRDVLGETISLYVRSGAERIRIQAVESNQPIRRVANIGKRFPLHIGASGKVLLAFSEQTMQELQNDPGASGEMFRPDFLAGLEQIRSQGYALSIAEREAGAAAVAAPIYSRQTLVAALSVSGPVDRFTTEAVERIAEAVTRSAENLTKLLSRSSL